MAVGTPYKVAAEAALVTASTDASITTNAIAFAGDTLFVWVACRLANSAVIATVTGHGSSNTSEIVSLGGGANLEGVSLFRVKLSADVASGTALTVTLNLSTSRKNVGAFAVPGLDDHVAITSSTNSGSTGTPTAANATHSLTDGIAIAIYQHNTTANTETGTVGAGYNKIGEKGVGASSFSAGFAQYKILSAGSTEAPAYTPSLTTTTNWLNVLGIWQGVPAGTAWTANPTDTVTLTDGISEFDYGMSLADSFTSTDAFSDVWTAQQAFADAITSSDALTFSYGMNPADSVSLADAFDRVWTAARALADALSATDALDHFDYAMAVADSATLSDFFSTAETIAWTLSLGDSVTLADALKFAYTMLAADLLAITDASANHWYGPPATITMSFQLVGTISTADQLA